MIRWIWFLPLGLVVLVLALYFFRLGWLAANISETDAINAYVARYLEQAGPDARITDCMAFPGEDTWLVLRCGSPGAWRGYWINRFGGLVRESGPGPWFNTESRQEGPRT